MAQKILAEDKLVTLVTIGGRGDFLLPKNFWQNNYREIAVFENQKRVEIWRCGDSQFLPNG